jgi:hypothetical protein
MVRSALAQERHDQDGAVSTRSAAQAARIDARIGAEQIAHHHRFAAIERGNDRRAEIRRRETPQQGRRFAIGPADIVIELVFLGQQLAKARTADGEMLAHQRGNLVQRGGGVIIAQHVGDLEAQRDPRLRRAIL